MRKFLVFYLLVIVGLSYQGCNSFKTFKGLLADGTYDGSSLNPSKACPAVDPEHQTIRKLSNEELSNSVRDLLGITDNITVSLPPDQYSGEGFTNNADIQKFTPDYVPKLMPAIETALSKAVSAKSPVFNCPTATKDKTCAQGLIRTFAQRAFRRPASDTEVNSMMTLFNNQTAAGDTFEGALSTAYVRALVSPNFLFRTSVSGMVLGNVVVNSQYEFAAKLSYFLWNSTPDQRLLDLAGQSALASEDTLRVEVDRMLKDPKAERFTQLFVGQWLGLDRILASGIVGRVGLTDQMRQDMVTESRMFASYILRQGKSIQDLIGGEYTFVNDRLAQHYGIPGVVGSEFRKVDLKGTGRRGLLNQAAFLTLQASPDYTTPTSRGNKILNLVVCAPPPPFPVDEEVTPLNVSGQLTIRQKLELHRADPKCAGCHMEMDPIGIGLEAFDWLGRYRATYSDGLPVESFGKLRGVSFNNSSELIGVITQQNDYKRCIAKNFMIYAVGRNTTQNDSCVLNQIGQLAVQSDKTFTDLVMSIVMSDQFRLNNMSQ